MAMKEEEEKGGLGRIIEVTNWFPKLVETQVDLIATTLYSILTTFHYPSFSLSSPTFFKPPHANYTDPLDMGSTRAQTQNHTHTHQSQHLFQKLGYGLLGALYAATVLTLLMAVAVVIGVVMVNFLVEKPVVVREKLYFDYTDVNPSAVFLFGGYGMSKYGGGSGRGRGVPVGHTFHVSVVFSVPESDYNREIGNFQIMAEVVATNGKLIAQSSQPSMLQFHSYPIRLMRTFILGVPILLGISHETQTIKVHMLQYKEDNHLRTEAVKITLIPRAGTPYLPQLYEAEIVMHSKLPRVKEFVHNWKWTFYVWTSMYVYAVMLMLLLWFFRDLLAFPISRGIDRIERREPGVLLEREEKPRARGREGREFSETLRKWQQYRRKRKSALLSRSAFTDNVGSTSASSYTVNKDDFEPTIEEDVGDSESVCIEG
ncbi:seipin-1-like [Chenopodium quinoa]|uniref:seipin-1-like n=1 Tax=Chenopodium quinoa TaxID=63459 RepID=UPI000B793406|nr:seipin-1-like [Chenopodium quinoa]